MSRDPTLRIRPVGADDESAWAALWRGYLAFYGTEVAPEVYAAAFARLLSDDPGTYRGLVAEIGGQPVGIAHYLFHAHMWRLEPVCYLQDLFVAPEARQRGAGRALIAAVYAAADAGGAPHVYWTTQHFNAAARQLYDRVGRLTDFVKYERVPGATA